MMGYEPETASLPTDYKLGNCWMPAVSEPFYSGEILFSVLSAPLTPSASFAV